MYQVPGRRPLFERVSHRFIPFLLQACGPLMADSGYRPPPGYVRTEIVLYGP
jgi:hypothetical protein